MHELSDFVTQINDQSTKCNILNISRGIVGQSKDDNDNERFILSNSACTYTAYPLLSALLFEKILGIEQNCFQLNAQRSGPTILQVSVTSPSVEVGCIGYIPTNIPNNI